MKKYARRISFRTLFIAFKRHFDVTLLLFSVSTLVTCFLSLFVIKKSYYSTTSIERYDSVVKEAQYNTVVTTVNGDILHSYTASELSKGNITHKNGDQITKEEIKNGISVENLETNSIYIVLKFECSDETIPQEVLTYATKILIDELNKKPDENVNGYKVAVAASDVQVNPRSNKTLYTGLVCSVVLAVVFTFLFEVILDEVYDADDIAELGGQALEIDMPKLKRKKEKRK